MVMMIMPLIIININVACDVHDDDDGSDHESPITPTAYLSMPTKDTSHETTKPRLFQCQIAKEKR